MCTPGATPTSSLLTTPPPSTDPLAPINVTAKYIPTAEDTQAKFGLLTQAGGALVSAAGAFTKAQATADTARFNARQASADALNQQRVGDSQAQKLYQQTSQIKGTQRASFAARGLDLGVGSPLDVLTSTDVMGANDQATLKQNTQQAVYADRDKAEYYKSQASNSNPFVAGATSLLTGASKVSSKWYDDKKSGLFGGS